MTYRQSTQPASVCPANIFLRWELTLYDRKKPLFFSFLSIDCFLFSYDIPLMLRLITAGFEFPFLQFPRFTICLYGDRNTQNQEPKGGLHTYIIHIHQQQQQGQQLQHCMDGAACHHHTFGFFFFSFFFFSHVLIFAFARVNLQLSSGGGIPTIFFPSPKPRSSIVGLGPLRNRNPTSYLFSSLLLLSRCRA